MDDAKRTERLEADVDADLIGAVRDLASDQRPFEGLLEEALLDLIEKEKSRRRDQILAIHEESIERFGNLYKKLAE